MGFSNMFGDRVISSRKAQATAWKARLLMLAVMPVGAVSATSALGSNLTWDFNGISPTAPADGAGNWDAATARWSNGTVDSGWDNASTAVFGAANGAAGNVTIDDPSGTVSAAGLTFNAPGSGNYTILASGVDTLTLLGASPTITVAPGVVATINAPLVGSAGMTVNGNLTLGGVSASFSGPINISAGATVLVKGNNGNGTAASAAAAWAALGFATNTETVGPYSSLGSVAPGSGNITIANGGTLSLNSAGANAVTFGQKTIFVQGTGATGTGAIINSTTANIRQFAAFDLITLTGDALFSGGRMDIGRDGDPSNLNPDVLDLAGHTLTLNMTTSTQPMFGIQAFPNGKGNNIGTTVTSGNIVVQAGTLDIETNTNMSNAGNSSVTFAASTTLGANLSANLELFKNDGTSCVRPMVFLGNNVLGPGAAASAATLASNITITGTLGFAANVSGAVGVGTGNCSVTLNGNITQNGNASVVQLGASTTTLAGTNSWSGGTDIERTGTLTLGSAGAFPAGTALSFGSISAIGGTFDLGGFSPTVSSLTVASGAQGNSFIGSSSTSSASTLIYAGNVSTPSIFNGTIEDSVTTLVNTNLAGLPTAQAGNQTTGVSVASGLLTLSGVNTYTGNTSVNGGELDVGSGGSLAGANIAVGEAGTFAVLSGGSISAGTKLTNNGTVNLNAATSIATLASTTGGTVNLNAAVLTVTTGGSYAGKIQDNGTAGGLIVQVGAVQTTGSVNANLLEVDGKESFANTAVRTLSKVNVLTVAGAPGAWSGALDLTSGRLVVEDSTANRATDIGTYKNMVANSVGGTVGIYSSTAAANGQVVVVSDNAVRLAAFGAAGSNFGTGVGNVDASSILITTAVLGDANLDGVVDIKDLQDLANHWQQPATDWSQADFDGNGVVALQDLQALANHWQNGVGAPGQGSGESFSEALALVGQFGSAASVPEPMSLAILGLGGVMLMRRRKQV